MWRPSADFIRQVENFSGLAKADFLVQLVVFGRSLENMTQKPSTKKRSNIVPGNGTVAAGWLTESERWAKWAREPGHDSYWRFHREQFFALLPEPGELTLDIGCGEGRVSRDLKRNGHNVIGIDVSHVLVDFAQKADPEGKYINADAASLPLPDECADLAIMFMSPQDIDDLESAILEMARVLKPHGRACFAFVHPLNSAGTFETENEDSEFIIAGTYLDAYQYKDDFVRDGLEITFHSMHRPLDHYSRALEKAGFLIEAIRENAVPEHANYARPKRWQRIPMFMHLRAIKFPK